MVLSNLPMMSHLFVFEPKPEFARKLASVWEHHFVIHDVAYFEAMETMLLSSHAGSAVILFNWDKWPNPLVYLQKMRIWHRLIPIVIVSNKLSHAMCLSVLREQVYTCLPRPLNIADLGAVLDQIFDDYEMISLRNMYYLSIRKRKFVFNKTMRYQEFQILAQQLNDRALVPSYVAPEHVFELPTPVILVIASDHAAEILAQESVYTVLVAKTPEQAFLLSDRQDIALVVMDVLLGVDVALFLKELTETFPKVGVLVWTASQDKGVATACFQVGVFDCLSKLDSDVSLLSKIETLLHMRWEMDASGDIALYTRQFLFAAHCRYAFHQGRPVFWSDWYLFFKRRFPENGFRTATDTPIPYDVFEQLGISGLSVLNPDPVAYPDIFGDM